MSAEELAKYEVDWWRAHHHKDFDKVIENMTLLYQNLFGILYEKAKEVVTYRVEAAKMHDEAEKLEDLGKVSESEIYWKKAEELLSKHFKLLIG